MAGCAERVPLAPDKNLSFGKALISGAYKINYRTIFIRKGQEFPVLDLSDGRKAVVLNQWTASDPFFPVFSNMQQINGSILDRRNCTTTDLVNINSRDVIIEKSVKSIPAGICFTL
jgi:hypothetical protein